jgi:glycine/serine hydroxymethyltransferase
MIGAMIASVVHEPESKSVKERVRREVLELTAKFPMYPTRMKQGVGGTA